MLVYVNASNQLSDCCCVNVLCKLTKWSQQRLLDFVSFAIATKHKQGNILRLY